MFCEVRVTKPAQAPKKPKKTKVKVEETSTGTKKNKKKQNFQELWAHFWVVAGNFVFFVFFGACAGLVHLVVCFFWFFWCLPMFCICHLKIMMKKLRFTRVLDPPSA